MHTHQKNVRTLDQVALSIPILPEPVDKCNKQIKGSGTRDWGHGIRDKRLGTRDWG